MEIEAAATVGLAEADAAGNDEAAASGGVSVGIAVCVMTRRSANELRDSIRQTWATSLQGEATLRFFVGSTTGDADVADLAFGDVVELWPHCGTKEP